ncbi:S24/S26 family peptidase [Lachnoclostridium sp. An181]|uniref:S24/S26 family peptidase n=1 Tax=Lachnoclostridium sp. An181 TaxID=1965575 RepID=UPI000B396671|nr:S24/S26 family peptidase [Lachnoclostridium sp. An181]
MKERLVDSLLEKALKEKGYIINAPVGESMLPLIRPDRDTVVLKRFEGQAKKYDIVLYKRANATYVLHRILAILPEGYVLCGDNQWVREYGVKKEQILAVMEGFYRDEKYIDVHSGKYCLYTKFWCLSLSARKCLLLLYRMLNRIKST